MTTAVAAAIAFGVAAVLCPVCARVATRAGIVDRPGALKVHERPVPYLGGLAVFAGMTVATAISGRLLLLVPGALALLLGLADDARGVPPAARAALEVPIGIAVAAIVPTRFPSAVGVVLCIAATIALVNAVNMLDGLDGLAGGVVAASAIGFAVIGRGDWRVLAAATAAAVVGFLLWNRPPARIYLGDAGAYALGATLAVLLAGAWRSDVPTSHSLASLLLVLVPAVELLLAVVRRLRAGTSPLHGDRDHTYDRLVQRGWSTARAAAGLVLAQATATIVAIAIAH
jgi:UDP-GlcNAc:undecaprenyl-phosphate GlcNAc-1-phosphate transferase